MGSEEEEAAWRRQPFQEGKRGKGPKLERDLGRKGGLFKTRGHFQAYADGDRTLP